MDTVRIEKIKQLIGKYKQQKITLNEDELKRKEELREQFNYAYLQTLIRDPLENTDNMCFISRYHNFVAELDNGYMLYENRKIGTRLMYNLRDKLDKARLDKILNRNRIYWNKAHKLGLAPKLHAERFCFGSMFLVLYKYVIWEYIPNQVTYALWSTMKKTKEEREKVKRMIQEKIALLHKHNIVHNDLTPQNILLVLKNRQVSNVLFVNFGESVPCKQDMRSRDNIFQEDEDNCLNYVTKFL